MGRERQTRREIRTHEPQGNTERLYVSEEPVS